MISDQETMVLKLSNNSKVNDLVVLFKTGLSRLKNKFPFTKRLNLLASVAKISNDRNRWVVQLQLHCNCTITIDFDHFNILATNVKLQCNLVYHFTPEDSFCFIIFLK